MTTKSRFGIVFMATMVATLALSNPATAKPQETDRQTEPVPTQPIHKRLTNVNIAWKRVPDVGQYKFASPGKNWDNEIMRAQRIDLSEAMKIAETNPKITFFMFVKGTQMYLEGDAKNQAKGLFSRGDVVFFGGKPWYGSAPGLADAYEKVLYQE